MLVTINASKFQAPGGVSLLHPLLIIQGYNQKCMKNVQTKYYIFQIQLVWECFAFLCSIYGSIYWYLTNSNATSSRKLIWFVSILYWTDLLQVLHMNKDRKLEWLRKLVQTFYFSFRSLYRWFADIGQFSNLWSRHLIC